MEQLFTAAANALGQIEPQTALMFLGGAWVIRDVKSELKNCREIHETTSQRNAETIERNTNAFTDFKIAIAEMRAMMAK